MSAKHGYFTRYHQLIVFIFPTPHTRAPLDVDMKTANMPLAEQRYAITKATYASHKFENTSDMSRYVKAAMAKKFGAFWEVFVETKESNKTVKRTCDVKNIMNFTVNDMHFIVCRVMR